MNTLSFINSTYTAILVVDQDGVISWVNSATEELFSASSKRLKKISIFSLLKQSNETNSDSQLTEKNLKPKIQKKNLSSMVAHDQWIQGVHYPLFVDYTISKLDTSNEFLVEIWKKDRHHLISQEKQQQTQHQIAKKMLRSVAHEVKNPLAGIRGAAQLLSKYQLSESKSNKGKIDKTKDNRTQTYTDIIISEADRLTTLINQLMGIKKLPDQATLNIHKSIEHVLTLIQSEEPNLQIIRDYDLSLPDIIADYDQLVQVFLNLTKNSIHAMQSRKNLKLSDMMNNASNSRHGVVSNPLNDTLSEYQPTLTVSTRVEFTKTIGKVRHKQVAKISIIDNGVGIPEDLVDQVFFPLVTGRPEGTGLGLSLVHDIIEQHKGQIEVKSKFGRTCFNLFFQFS